MARFTPENEADKQALIARALKLKPRHQGNIVATDKGWSIPHANGYMELLVSFAGLDSLLGEESTADQDVSAEPVEVQAESVPVETTDVQEDASTESTEEAPVKKKGGRPKKVVEEKADE
jgi:hypothetical protein